MRPNPVLYILRGLPGSGKSTLAKRICPNYHFEADQYHIVEGEYRFDPAKVKKAHEWCQSCAAAVLVKRQHDVAVSNTFTQRWEYQPYLTMAKEAGYDVQVIECHGPWQNVHNVPDEVLSKMRQRWEPHQSNP